MTILQKVLILVDASARLLLLHMFLSLELVEPFHRIIHQEEKWLYQNPITQEYVSSPTLWKMVAILPTSATLFFFIINRSFTDVLACLRVFTLSLPLTGFITDATKLLVGRPRPDFLFRCWPDGDIPLDAFSAPSGILNCTGDPFELTEGRKSFPSGHASFSFTCWGFLFLYISGKIGTFHPKQVSRISGVKLSLSLLLLLAPTLICVSRTMDYHHHWQDVSVGGGLGLGVVWASYRIYFPSISQAMSGQPLGRKKVAGNKHGSGIV